MILRRMIFDQYIIHFLLEGRESSFEEKCMGFADNMKHDIYC